MKPIQKESIMNETHDVDLLNEGLQGEYFGITAYDAALGSGLLSAKVATVAKGFQADHRAHAQAIREAIERLRGRASAPKTWKEYAASYPPPKLASETDVLQYAASLERSAAVADTKMVAKLHGQLSVSDTRADAHIDPGTDYGKLPGGNDGQVNHSAKKTS